MPKPFANSQPITPSLISGDWLLGIQTGNSTGDNGLPQMKYIKLSQLTDWVRSNFGEMWRYRGAFSASLPSDPQDGDYFLATATFTVGADTYTKDHLYAYNGSSWDDISDILTQYASQAQVTDIDDRLTVVEVKVDAMGDGIVYKGEVATYADLAGIADPQTGWEYFVTANASFYIYNGSSWDQIDNGIVQTITDGDTAHAPSGDAVYGALAAEAAARTAADSNLKSAIQGNTARIENLEQEHGGYVPVNYRGTNAVPTGKAKYALAESIVGKSRAWNQPVTNGNFANGDNWTDAGFYATTRTVANNVMTLSSPNGRVDVAQILTTPLVAGHKYLVSVTASRDVSGTLYTRLAGGGGNQDIAFSSVSTSLVLKAEIITADYNSEVLIFFATGLTSSCQISRVILRDLTTILNDWANADITTANIPQMVKQIPDLLKYDNLFADGGDGYSLPSTTVSGICTTSINILDEVWEAGRINGSDGELVSDSTALRTKNFIPVNSNTDYYVMCSTAMMHLAWYDVGKNYISGNSYASSNSKRTSPANAFYLKFSTDSNYGSTFKDDLQICLDSASEKTIYHPYILATLTLPSSVTLRSAGSVADTDELNIEINGVARRRKTTRVSIEYDLGDFDFVYSSSTNNPYFRTDQPLTGIKIPASTGDMPNLECSRLIPKDYNYVAWQAGADDSIGINSSGYITISVNKLGLTDPTDPVELKGKASGIKFTLELATYSVTLLDPIENNTILTEGGGTINTIQTQTTKIDNCLDVGYLAL